MGLSIVRVPSTSTPKIVQPPTPQPAKLKPVETPDEVFKAMVAKPPPASDTVAPWDHEEPQLSDHVEKDILLALKKWADGKRKTHQLVIIRNDHERHYLVQAYDRETEIVNLLSEEEGLELKPKITDREVHKYHAVWRQTA